MAEIVPTSEQLAVLAEARTDASLCIEADAGAAKTTTLRMLAKKLPLVPTLCCAFNKRIADEMQQKMPAHIACQTMNSIGHRAWAKASGKRAVIDKDKMYNLVQEFYKLHYQGSALDKKWFGERMASILRAARFAKSNGYVPESMLALGKSFMSLEDFLDVVAPHLDCDPAEDDFMSIVDKILEQSIQLAYTGRIDFDDQIFMSCCFASASAFPKYEIIMVDEAQDLSSMNHEMIRRMFVKRLIIVGDSKQGIYLFRGAKQGSMNLLREEFSMKELHLHVSFRCPIKVVERARSRAPNMAYPDWAKEGVVQRLPEWDPLLIPDGAAIICRNNAPLFKCALNFIRVGRGVKIVGSDIGKSLIKNLESFGDSSLGQEALINAILAWEEENCADARESRQAVVRDRAACLRVFAEAGKTLGEAVAFATRLFEEQGKIEFLSGHKAKGLEYDVVYHLDSFLIPSKHAKMLAESGDESQLEQERNLRYVIETRSMEALYLINSEDMR